MNTNDPVRVSDHALIRYMQQVLQIDVEQLRGLLADSCSRHQGAPCVRALGARFLIVNETVVTVIGGKVVPRYDTLVALVQQSAEEPA